LLRAKTLTILIMALAFSARLHAFEYQWVLLNPQNDSRDPEVRDTDEAFSRNMVAVINQSEDLFHHRVIWKKARITDLLKMDAPFCEMHFDAVRPFDFTPEEKEILAEYFKRGGFILFFIDAYPYDQDEFWKVKQWPLINFLTRELPRDPDFTASRVTDDSPLFKVHYQTEAGAAIRHELDGNPNTPNRIVVYQGNRLCGFVMGDYNVLGDNGKWVAEPRPFSREFSSELSGYERVVDVYVYSIVQ
jgi:hypothetical protein